MMKVCKEDTGYSAVANIGQDLIGTQAEAFEELKTMVLEAVNLSYEDQGIYYLPDEIRYEFDLESFFSALYKTKWVNRID